MTAVGVSAFAIGALLANREIDEANTRVMVQAAAPHPCTFHRAFDVCVQPVIDSIDAIERCGCLFVLTSGRAKSALEGIEVLKAIQQHTARIGVVAGAGVTPSIAHMIACQCNVFGIHGSFSSNVCVAAVGNGVRMGVANDSHMRVCDKVLVGEARDLLASLRTVKDAK
jgi:copper homeostasis protein CutC